MCKANNYSIESARSEYHVIEGIRNGSFNNRYTSTRSQFSSPESLDYLLAHSKGEFSIDAEASFQKHLKWLKAKVI